MMKYMKGLILFLVCFVCLGCGDTEDAESESLCEARSRVCATYDNEEDETEGFLQYCEANAESTRSVSADADCLEGYETLEDCQSDQWFALATAEEQCNGSTGELKFTACDPLFESWSICLSDAGVVELPSPVGK